MGHFELRGLIAPINFLTPSFLTCPSFSQFSFQFLTFFPISLFPCGASHSPFPPCLSASTFLTFHSIFFTSNHTPLHFSLPLLLFAIHFLISHFPFPFLTSLPFTYFPFITSPSNFLLLFLISYLPFPFLATRSLFLTVILLHFSLLHFLLTSSHFVTSLITLPISFTQFHIPLPSFSLPLQISLPHPHSPLPHSCPLLPFLISHFPFLTTIFPLLFPLPFSPFTPSFPFITSHKISQTVVISHRFGRLPPLSSQAFSCKQFTNLKLTSCDMLHQQFIKPFHCLHVSHQLVSKPPPI